jgi:choline-sulfatase
VGPLRLVRAAALPAYRSPALVLSLRAAESPAAKQYAKAERPRHPYLDTYAHTVDYDTHFASDDDVRRAVAGYSGLVSLLDENIGHVLSALRDAGLEESTRVIYTATTATTSRARTVG